MFFKASSFQDSAGEARVYSELSAEEPAVPEELAGGSLGHAGWRPVG
jgi:hypothetical protein